MNIGRYLRGEDRHVGTARVSKEKQQSTVDIDPMDTPLPCDVKVGHVTIRKGVALRTLVARMQVLYDMAQQRKPLTPHEIGRFVGTHSYGPEQLKWFRFGEAAHGIKE